MRHSARTGSLALALSLALAAGGCERESRTDPIVARVGSAALTAEDLRAALDTSRSGSLSADAYVNDWVITEILYQEAMRRGLLETPDMVRRLKAVEKRMAVAALLEEEVYDDRDTLAITDGMLSSYLDSAAQEFTLTEDVVLLSYAAFDDRAAANRFRAAALRGGSWDAAVESARQDSQIVPHLIQVVDRSYETQGTFYPQELWRLARSLGIGDVSFVLRPQSGSLYYVIKIHNVKGDGALADLAYVRDRIRDRILVAMRQEKYARLLDDLRARQRIEVRPQQSPVTGGEE